MTRYRQVHRTCSEQNRQVRESNCLVPDVGRAICSGLPAAKVRPIWHQLEWLEHLEYQRLRPVWRRNLSSSSLDEYLLSGVKASLSVMSLQ